MRKRLQRRIRRGSQDLLANLLAQIIEQLPRGHAALFCLDPRPVEQGPEAAKGHARGGESESAAARAVCIRNEADRLGGSPIAEFSIVGNGGAGVLGDEEIFPERGKSTVAVWADLWELPFEMLAHRFDNFRFGHFLGGFRHGAPRAWKNTWNPDYIRRLAANFSVIARPVPKKKQGPYPKIGPTGPDAQGSGNSTVGRSVTGPMRPEGKSGSDFFQWRLTAKV